MAATGEEWSRERAAAIWGRRWSQVAIMDTQRRTGGCMATKTTMTEYERDLANRLHSAGALEVLYDSLSYETMERLVATGAVTLTRKVYRGPYVTYHQDRIPGRERAAAVASERGEGEGALPDRRGAGADRGGGERAGEAAVAAPGAAAPGVDAGGAVRRKRARAREEGR